MTLPVYPETEEALWRMLNNKSLSPADVERLLALRGQVNERQFIREEHAAKVAREKETGA